MTDVISQFRKTVRAIDANEKKFVVLSDKLVADLTKHQPPYPLPLLKRYDVLVDLAREMFRLAAMKVEIFDESVRFWKHDMKGFEHHRERYFNEVEAVANTVANLEATRDRMYAGEHYMMVN